MIAYQETKVQEIYDSVIGKLITYRTEISQDYKTILNLINQCIRKIYVTTVPFKKWSFVYRLRVTNNTTLPREYIQVRELLVSEAGFSPYTKADYVKPQEWLTYTYWERKHSWKGGRAGNPVYTIWAETNPLTSQSELRIKIYPNTEFESGTPPTGYAFENKNFSGELTYYGYPKELESRNEVVPIPYEFIPLLVDMVVMLLLSKSGESQLAFALQTAIAEQTKAISLKFGISQTVEAETQLKQANLPNEAN